MKKQCISFILALAMVLGLTIPFNASAAAAGNTGHVTVNSRQYHIIGQNLITNSSFESNLDGWTSGTGAKLSTLTSDWSRSSTYAKDGKYALHGLNNGGGNTDQAIKQSIPLNKGKTVPAGKKYYLSYWVYFAGNGSTEANFTESLAKGDVTADSDANLQVSESGGNASSMLYKQGVWHHVAYILTTTAETRDALLWFRWLGTNAYFDDFSLVEVTDAQSGNPSQWALNNHLLGTNFSLKLYGTDLYAQAADTKLDSRVSLSSGFAKDNKDFLWTGLYRSDGHYRIQNLGSSYYLNASTNKSFFEGSDPMMLLHSDYANDTPQQWAIKQVDPSRVGGKTDVYTFQDKASGKYLSANTDQTAAIGASADAGKGGQWWELQTVSLDPIANMFDSAGYKSLPYPQQLQLYNYTSQPVNFSAAMRASLADSLKKNDYFNLSADKQAEVLTAAMKKAAYFLVSASGTSAATGYSTSYTLSDAQPAKYGEYSTSGSLSGYKTTLTLNNRDTGKAEQTIILYTTSTGMAKNIAEAYARIPYEFRKFMKTIIQSHNNANQFNAGANAMYIRCNFDPGPDQITQTSAHELGHSLDANHGWWTQGSSWSEARALDMSPVSSYGNSNNQEDFAEFSRLVISSLGNPVRINAIKMIYPNRWERYNALLDYYYDNNELENLQAHSITIDKGTNGTVTADKTTATSGTKITLTVTPAAGYQLKTLTATSNGQSVAVNTNTDGTHSFVMPAGDVAITAAFASPGSGSSGSGSSGSSSGSSSPSGSSDSGNPGDSSGSNGSAGSSDAVHFTDAGQIPDHAKDAVNYLVGNGAISGFKDGTFRPLAAISRKDAARILTKIVPSSDLTPDDGESFTDVDEHNDFYRAVVAVTPKLFGGLNGKFMPENNLTRAETAKIIVNAYSLTGNADLSKFSDTDSIGNDLKSYVADALANGLISGYPDGAFSPNTSVTRADFATILFRAINH